MLVQKWYRPRNIRSMWFGEGEGEGGSGDGGAPEGGGADKDKKPDDKGGGKEKTFNQKQVDDMISARFKKEREEKEKLIQQLTSLQESQNLSAAEKENLAQQIGDLQASLRTKEETAAITLKTVEGKYQKQVSDLTTDRDTWKGRFVDSLNKRNLSDGAIANDAEEPSQIVMMFGPQARLEEVKVDGKPTGDYVTMLKFQGIDPETKKPVMMDLPPAEAFQHMRENGLHKNLWKHGGKPGTGAGAGGGGGKNNNPSKEPMPGDYATPEEYGIAYQKWRDEYHIDGTPIKRK